MPLDDAVPLTLRRAVPFKPSSIDEDKRTVELIASTGAGVERRDMNGTFLEILSLASGAVDLSRLDGMPLLDSHRQDGLQHQLGVVLSGRVEDKTLIVRVQISERAEAIWKDVKMGIIRNVSIGYEALDAEDRNGAMRERVITKWRLMEVSLVPIGADGGAKVRSLEMPEVTTKTLTRADINKEIRSRGKAANVEAAVIDDLIDREASVDEASSAILDALKTRRAPGSPRVEVLATLDAPEAVVTRMGEALYARAVPTFKPSEEARPYLGLTTLDMARECLRMRGISTTGLNPATLIERALHTTSDFPTIFADTANRTLRAAYQAAPAVLKRLARQTTARDFRAKTAVQIGQAPTLEKVNEHGEYKYGSMAESKETYRLGTYGKIIGLTRQAIVNDDLGAFTDLAGKFGASAAAFEAQFLVDLLVSGSGLGPDMDDTNPLFDATHGNLATSGAAPSDTTLNTARLAMRRQKGISGEPINVAPKFVLVPPELETATEKVLATIQPTKTSDVNPFGGKLDLLVEARLTNTKAWYLIADPAVIEGLEYAYLAGEEGPQTETRAGFEIDGVETKVRLDFGASFLDWRSWYRNPGQ